MEKSDQEEKSWSMASRTATQNRDGLDKKRNGAFWRKKLVRKKLVGAKI